MLSPYVTWAPGSTPRIFGGGVPPGSPNPDPFSDQVKNHTHFQA